MFVTFFQELKQAGYFSSSKEIDPRTGEKVMRPVRPMSSASKAAYFSLPPLGAGIAYGAGAGSDPRQKRMPEDQT